MRPTDDTDSFMSEYSYSPLIPAARTHDGQSRGSTLYRNGHLVHCSQPTPPPRASPIYDEDEGEDEDEDEHDDDDEVEHDYDDDDTGTDGSEPGGESSNHVATSAADDRRTVDLSANIREAFCGIGKGTGLEEIIDEEMLTIHRATEEGITQLLRLKSGIEEFREKSEKGRLILIEGLLSEANKQLLRLDKVKRRIGEAADLIRELPEEECICKWYSRDNDSTT